MGLGTGLRAALDAHKRTHVTIINTERGEPFTVDGFSGFIGEAGSVPSCNSMTIRRTILPKPLLSVWEKKKIRSKIKVIRKPMALPSGIEPLSPP
jgi:hypothetical protein